MDNKVIYYGKDARESLKKGIDAVANAVKVTLGYGGRTVVISETGLPSRTTKDGVTVAKAIKLRDQVQDAGAKFVKEVASNTADAVGDGTTSVTILMQHLVSKGLDLINAGVNPVFLKKGMDAAAANVIEQLKSMVIPADEKLLEAIATVSANNDPVIGKLIGDAYKQLGPHGIIFPEDSKSHDTYIDVVDGFQFDSGFLTHHFITNYAKNTCELHNPYVLIASGKINSPEDIWELINKVAIEGRSILIIAEDFDFAVTQTLLKNHDKFKSCLVKYNYIGDTKHELMYDLLAMTGATLAEKQGDKLKTLTVDYLGECEKVVVSDEDTLIIKGRQVKNLVEARIEDAKVKIENAKHEFIKQKQEKRLAKLSGCLAVCYVGGATEVEVSEKKDRIDDSIKATKAAIQEGVLPGAGTSLIRCEQALYSMVGVNNHFKDGVYLVAEALSVPCKQIILNNGENPDDLIMNKIKMSPQNVGYNAINGGIQNLVDAGIVDPLKVVRLCIENAVSASGQVLTSEALIVTDHN